MNVIALVKKIVRKILRRKTVALITKSPINGVVRGRVLFSYLAQPIAWKESDDRFNWHCNCWESREIVKIFNGLGFVVDCIEWNDTSFYPTKEYDIVFDIAANLQRLAPFLHKETLKILHLTGSYPFYQRNAELERVAQLETRTGGLYSPRRIYPYFDLSERSLRLSDVCSLIGNEHTLMTFPEEYRKKTSLVTVSASVLSFVKNQEKYITKEQDFFYFSGGGAVHKGLDLLLEVFARNNNFRLHIVGNVSSELDFFKIYEKELTSTENIFYHGALAASSDAFIKIVKKCMYFISPSCSEGISSSVATCLQLGLYPILSEDSGVTLPAGKGIMLKNCSIDEIEAAIKVAVSMDDDMLIDHIKTCQAYALNEYSRSRVTEKMRDFLEVTIANRFQNKVGR